MKQIQQLRYFLYARKSSESEDRQMASIEDQIGEVIKIAKEHGLQIVATYSESKSAKAPGRKAFNEMLSQIEQGKADGILCWKLNRLARNPVDGGKISWMLQQSIIKHIQCYGRDYKPSDNVLMMQVELGMANQFIKDLSTDIKRGTRAKAGRGWNPSPVLPIGYIHNKNNKRKVNPQEIITDPIRFSIIKKLWMLILTGNYNLAEIKRQGDKMGLVSDSKRPYVIATYHQLFRSEFYCGYFYWKDANGVKIRHKGKHKTIVTEKEFEEVQYIVGNRKRPTRAKQYDYPYRGLIKCGECGCGITAERKYQVRCTGCRFKFSCMHRDSCPKCETAIQEMKNPTEIDITYYRCTKRKKKCSQKFITQQDLEKQYMAVLQFIEVPQGFYELMVQELERINLTTDQKQLAILQLHKKRTSELKNRLKQLSLMRADNEIDKEEFIAIKEVTKKSIVDLENELKSMNNKKIDWLLVAKDYLNLALKAPQILKNKDNLTKNGLLSKLGSNQYLFDQKLHFIKAKPLLVIKNCFEYYEAEKQAFELKNPLEKQGEFNGFDSQNSSWCTGLNQVRTSIHDYHKAATTNKLQKAA